MSLRRIAGALVYDCPRFARAFVTGRWERMWNRDERVTIRGRGVRCEWKFTSDLHISKVFPQVGRWLMRRSLSEWPIAMRDSPENAPATPAVSFVIGHRGTQRLPLLLSTLRSIAGQEGVACECIVVEEGAEAIVEHHLPPWVGYRFRKSDQDYNRSAAFNAGVELAKGDVVILHDGDMLVPRGYAAAVLSRARIGCDFIDLKRFVFYLSARATEGVLAGRAPETPDVVVQNLVGGSIAVNRDAYWSIGGFDEEFVGWGGEDNDFWDRAETTSRAFRFGELPMIHLFHEPQAAKLQGSAAPAVKRYRELESIAPEERIRRLRERRR